MITLTVLSRQGTPAELAPRDRGGALGAPGTPGHGRQAGPPPSHTWPLVDGDELRVGDYVLGVRLVPTPEASTRRAPAARISADWDSFAPAVSGMDSPVSTAPSMSHPPPLRATAGEDSLDALFGLRPSEGDPMREFLLETPVAQPNTAHHPDPWRSLGMLPQATPATVADDSSDLHRPFSPRPQEEPELAALMGPHEKAALDAPGLLGALCNGLALPQLPDHALTPALMHRLGQVLRESVDGVRALLAQRVPVERHLDGGGPPGVIEGARDSAAALCGLLFTPAGSAAPPGVCLADAFRDLLDHHRRLADAWRDTPGRLRRQLAPEAIEAGLPTPAEPGNGARGAPGQ